VIVLNYVYLTAEGLQKIKKELHELKFTKRPKVSQKVATAREHGDLKENAEYHAAREELSLLETKIQQLQDRIARARIIKEEELERDHVTIFSKVRVEDQKRKKEYEYILVSEAEADAKKDKISITSPVGKGLLGKKTGEIAEISVPAGVLKYKVLSISR
jgi:transcription elongation factor GreA